MIELLKEIILDGQLTTLFTGTNRRVEVTPVPNKATVIIGVRRCGKSIFINQVVNKYLISGVNRENILYVNLFDDRLSFLNESNLDLILQAYFLIYPAKKNAETIYCFFDEVQVVKGWESFIERLMRTENCVVYLSGSSAKLLSKEIATQMRGRALSWELFPFSFNEFTDQLNMANEPPFNSQQRILLENAYEKYWESGGFPEVIPLDKNMRRKIHQEYFNSILFRDLIERYDLSHPRALIDLARKLTDNIASKFTINNLTGFLKSLGHTVPKSSVSDYVNWFEDAYFLFTVRLFDASYRRSVTNPKKIYCIDHAMVKSLSSGVLINSGHLLENMVFIHLRRKNEEIFYYKTKKGNEVDFILKDNEGQLVLIQVCESLIHPETRQREIKALEEAMTELELTSSTIVTKNESGEIPVNGGSIFLKPAWRFLLEGGGYS